MTTQAKRNSLPSLWEQAGQLWDELVLGFGNAALIMRWGFMRALEHRALGHWLRDLEKLVRRAIRDDAEDLDLPPLKPRAPRPGPRPQPREDRQGSPGGEADLPATWKASFHMHPRASGKRTSRKRKEPAERRPCRGYAVRIEALRRVLCYRDAYILRYARRLARIREANNRALAEALKGCCPPEETTGVSTPEPAQRNAKHVDPG